MKVEDPIDALREVDPYSSPRPIRNSSPDSPSPDLTPNGAAQSSAISTSKITGPDLIFFYYYYFCYFVVNSCEDFVVHKFLDIMQRQFMC